MKLKLDLLRALYCIVLGNVLALSGAHADTLKVAVASNALKAVTELGEKFTSKTGHQVLLSSGSTSKLYTQILHGAPFDVFLAANEHEAAELEGKGLILPGTRVTYAIGQLALYSRTPGRFAQDGASYLRAQQFARLAIANPQTAPYGNAAREVLRALQLWEQVQPKLVRGENIGQVFHYSYTCLLYTSPSPRD